MSIDNVEDLDPRNQYTAFASQTAFDYTFPIFEDADLVVVVDGVTKALDTDYEVSGAGDDTGGTVTFMSAMSGSEIVTIYRDISIERLTDIAQNGPWSSTSYNDEQDKTYLLLRDLKRDIGRALRIPLIAEVDSGDIELSPVASWANKFVFINSSGAPEPASIVTGTISQTIISDLLFPVSSTETADNVTVVNSFRVYGDARRYANGLAEPEPTLYCFGNAPIYVDSNTFKLLGNFTSRYSRGQRVFIQDVSTGCYGRILNSTYSSPYTTIDLIQDIGGSIPTTPLAVSLQVAASTRTKNAFIQDLNQVTGQDFINKNLGSSAASRLVIGNYDSDSSGGQTANESAVAIVVTGGTYSASYLPGLDTGRNVIIHTGLPIPITLGTNDTARIFIPKDSNPILFFNTIKSIGLALGLRIDAPSDPGNAFQAWYRSDETTRKGYFGFASGGLNNNISLINEESGRIIIQTTAGGDITLASFSDVQLAVGSGGFVKYTTIPAAYADDAAAATGGVPVGGTYRTASALKVRVS